MESCADSVRVAYPLFQAGGVGSNPNSALQYFFMPIDLSVARKLVRKWHSRLPLFGRFACRIAYGAEIDGIYYATAIWTNPLSSSLPQMEWLELNRMAISTDAPKNTASRFLGWMARDILKRFPDVVNLLSYQDTEVHTGGIYKAAGWSATVLNRFSKWDRPSRPRSESISTAPKQRWEKQIRRFDA